MTGAITSSLKQKATLEDLGLKLRPLDEQKALSLESNSNIINDTIAQAAQESAAASSLQDSSDTFLSRQQH